MDDYAGRVLADRYRLPLPPSDEYELAQTRAFDTYSGQEVLVRQVPLPELVEAEVLDADGLPEGFTGRGPAGAGRIPDRGISGGATRTPADPAVRRAIEAAQAAAQIPDHPRLDQVFDVFAEGGSLWIVSEVVAASPLAALLAEAPLSPYRAAEVAADVLTALRALHAHGWVHRNITTRTVLVCEDGRVLLTGLAAGAAEEALCGYDPTPDPSASAAGTPGGALPQPPGMTPPGPAAGSLPGPEDRPALGSGSGHPADSFGPAPAVPSQQPAGALGPAQGPSGAAPGHPGVRPGHTPPGLPGPASAATAGAGPGTPAGSGAGPGTPAGPGAGPGTPGPGAAAQQRSPYPAPGGMDARAARAGAIAAYRAGARAAAGIGEDQQPDSPPSLPAARRGDGLRPRSPAQQDTPQSPGLIVDPYGVRRPQPPAPRPAQDDLPEGYARPEPDADGPVPGEALSVTWGEPAGWGADGAARRGPATPLAAERARQARMAVVGPVTERWAPEQAGPVHENWQLAPPIGPETDLWALGALLFRAVQGHAPYPEESTPELVEMVCSEPPAFAEECGPLRPVVESLLRQDPAERPDFEELRGWLRSLIRSAPEPDAGAHVVATPPVDAEKLPIVRRRGDLVRRRRGTVATTGRGRHKAGRGGGPKRLGRTLLVVIMLGLAAAVAYAMVFMPKSDTAGQQAVGDPTGAPAPGSSSDTGAQGSAAGGQIGEAGASPSRSASSGTHQPDTTPLDVPPGFTVKNDSAGFRIAVADGWHRQGKNELGQVVYSKGDFQLIVVPGRDTAKEYGSDPMVYEREKERELQPFRDSSWATSSGLRTTEVGDRKMAEGQFTWQGDSGGVYVRNLALLVGGHYHIVQVRGPESQRDKVDGYYTQASATYQHTR